MSAKPLFFVLGLAFGAYLDSVQHDPADSGAVWNFVSDHYHEITGTAAGIPAGTLLGWVVETVRADDREK